MTDDTPRAILTDREREILSGAADVDDHRRYKTASRVRSKLDRLDEDVDLLDEHHQQLADELRDIVGVDGDRDVDPFDRVPGSGDLLERRRETIDELYKFLAAHGTASREDFLALVDPDEVGYQDAESFWSNCVAGRGTLAEMPGVEAPESGGSTWRFRGRP